MAAPAPGGGGELIAPDRIERLECIGRGSYGDVYRGWVTGGQGGHPAYPWVPAQHGKQLGWLLLNSLPPRALAADPTPLAAAAPSFPSQC